MIVACPGNMSAGKIDAKHFVSQIDILPTMLAYSNIKTDLSFTGKSLKPIIDNPSEPWRDHMVVELADFVKDPTRKGRMLRLNQYKYNIYSTGEDQLFDLKNDPGEKINLANLIDFSKIRTQCREKLKKWAEETEDTFALNILKI